MVPMSILAEVTAHGHRPVVKATVHTSGLTTVRVSKAQNVEGPWQDRTIMQTDLSNPTAWNCNKSNPSAIILKNGSILMMYRGVPCERQAGCKNSSINLCQHQGIAYAEN